MVMYYLFAIFYCFIAFTVAGYAVFKNSQSLITLKEAVARDDDQAQDLESVFEASASLFGLSHSRMNDMMLYIPAALQGVLYIIYMREIETAFIDSAIASEHNRLLPANQSGQTRSNRLGSYT